MKEQIINLIGEVCKVATQINMQFRHHVFVDLQGHVQQVQVRIYKEGWGPKRNYDDKFDIYYWEEDGDEPYEDDTVEQLEEILEELKKYLEV